MIPRPSGTFRQISPKAFRLEPEQNLAFPAVETVLNQRFSPENSGPIHFHRELTDFRRFGREDAKAQARLEIQVRNGS